MKIQRLLMLYLGMSILLTSCQKLEDPSEPPVPPGATYYVPQPNPDNNNNVPVPGLTGRIIDPLTNGQTVGEAYGGVFTAEGFQVTTNYGGYLAYSTDIYKNIRIEFDARGYVSWEDDEGDGKLVILEIFDSPHHFIWNGPAYDSQYCLFHFRKRGLYEGEYHYKVDGVEVKFGGKGKTDEITTWNGPSPAGHPLEWDDDVTYHWSITVQNGYMQITRNGQIIFAGDCEEFDPDYALNVRIGGVPYPGRTGSQNVTYSNVSIFGL